MTDNTPLKEHEILDMETYEDLQTVMGDSFHDLLREFIRDTPAVLKSLNHAIAASDFEQIFLISHSIQGSTGNLGISHLSELLKQIQQPAKSENIEHCIQINKEIETAFELAKTILLKKLNKP